MNVLSIGNSFSQNAHAFLPGMMKADGCDDFNPLGEHEKRKRGV